MGPVVGGARGTAIMGGAGMVDPAASRGAFSLNIHGTNGKQHLFLYFPIMQTSSNTEKFNFKFSIK